MAKSKEQQEQLEVCLWIKANYPEAIFKNDVSGMHMHFSQRTKQHKMRSPSKGWPDLMFFDARHGFKGLAIEYKKTGTKILKRDGNLRKNDHLHTQQALHFKLSKAGWLVGFVVGLDDCKETIKQYYGQIVDISERLIF